MRYFFESAIEKKEKGYMIRVPFNVWEVCKQRDVIQAEIVLDNDIIECDLLPIEKGNYEIHIEDGRSQGSAWSAAQDFASHQRLPDPYGSEQPLQL